MKNYCTPILVACVCLLAFGPLLPGFFGPEWRAKWIIARAANEYLDGHPENANQSLKRAELLSHEIAAEPEYWNLKFDLVFNKEKPTPDAVAALFQDCVALIARTPATQQPIIAYMVGERFHLRRENDFAVKTMERFFPPLQSVAQWKTIFWLMLEPYQKRDLKLL